MDYEVREYGFADGDVAAEVGLPPRDGGWGVLFGVDENGEHHSFAGSAEYLRLLLDIPPDAAPGSTGGRNMVIVGVSDFSPDAFPLRKRGWPDDWSSDEETAEWRNAAEG